MVALGVSRRESELARKRSRAARDLPDAGGPVIRREAGNFHYKRAPETPPLVAQILFGALLLFGAGELRSQVRHDLFELGALVRVEDLQDAGLAGRAKIVELIL